MISSDLKKRRFALLSIPLAVMAACNAPKDQSAPADPIIEHQEVEAPMTLNRQIALSKADLAERLNVPLDAVVLSGAQQVTWRSGALGCPEPGMLYTEALVPGAVIYLQVNNTIHAYHASFAGEPFYCPRERVEPPVPGDSVDPT